MMGTEDALVHFIIYKLLDLPLSLHPKPPTLQTNNHFTRHPSICAAVDLTISNLTHTAAYWTDSVQLLLVST